MVTIPTGLAINTSVAADRTTASGMRKALGAMLQQSTGGVPVPGILYAPGNPLTVTGHATLMQYTVTAGFAVTTRAGQGAYIVGTTSAVTVATIAAHATAPRYDVIYIVQPDPELAEAGVARIDVVNGVAATTPAVPAIPTGALELGRKLIAAGAANTSVGAAITNRPALVGANIGSHTHDDRYYTEDEMNAKLSVIDNKLPVTVYVQAAQPAAGAPLNALWFW